MTSDTVDDLALPGEGETLQVRRDSVRAARDHLAEHGSATAEELVREVYGHYASSAHLAASPEEWWTEVGRPGLLQLRGVRPPADEGGCWTYGAP